MVIRVALAWLLSMCLAASAVAQSIQPIYAFTNGPANPYAGLVQGPDGNFYGTTAGGGSSGNGTVFEMTRNGVLTTLASFAKTNGEYPEADLTLGPDGNFYGTTVYGGSSVYGGGNGYGTVFVVTTNGVLTTLVSFDNTNGANPSASLTLGADGNFYGTTSYGGSNGYGTVFNVTTNGLLTTLYSFTYPASGPATNSDGAIPDAVLTLGPDGNFYGTTEICGSGGNGTVFKLMTNGLLTTLHSFTATIYNGSAYINSDGASPQAGLTLGTDGNFYGTTVGGGSSGNGTVFEVTTNGVLTTLHSFSTTVYNGAYTNSDGVNPDAGLTLGADGNFYGTTEKGGSGGYGTVFEVTTNGGFTTLAALPYADDMGTVSGLTPGADGNLYGTTFYGGRGGYGTIFEVTTNGVLTTLVSFPNTDGAGSVASLTLGADDNLYGTASGGGNSGGGTVFKVTTNGVLTALASFANTNGEYPHAGLTQGADGNFYGTTGYGGRTASGTYRGFGTVFKVTTNGLLTSLISFASANGAYPDAGLTLGPNNNLYGTTQYGGSKGDGNVFEMTTNGTLTTLVSFNKTNGAVPVAGLTWRSDGNFYGTTSQGGSNGYGTVFKVTTNGVFTTLVSFANSNGASPYAGLTLGLDGNFYGSTYSGGSSGNGTVFEVTTNGVLITLVSFANSNGASPYAGLTLGPDGNFYGTTVYSGSNSIGYGTVFKVTANGTLTTLASFANTNGANPFAGLTLGPDGNFYGTTQNGGPGSGGEIYRLNLPPTILAGPTNLSVIAGGNANFAVSLFGTASFSYQWLFNGLPLAGDTNGILTLSNIAAINAGTYQVIVTNTWGSVTSGPAALTVLLPPVITNQPANETLPIGSTASFAVSASGTTPLAYQWYFNNTAMGGAIGGLLSIGPVFTNNAGSYEVVVTNLYGSATSSVASLAVLLVPNPYGISGSAGGVTVLYLASIPGSTNRLWATTNLNLPITQWQVIATNIATNGFFQVSDMNANEGPVKYYRLSTP